MLTNRSLPDPDRLDDASCIAWYPSDLGTTQPARNAPVTLPQRRCESESGFARIVARQHRAVRSLACTSCAIDMVWVSTEFDTWNELEPLPREDGFLLILDLGPGGRRQRFDGDVCSWEGATQAHSIHLLALDEPPRMRLRGSFDALLARLSRPALDEFTNGSLLPPANSLHCQPGTLDPILGAVGEALIHAMREPACATRLYLDQLATAMIGKLLASYSPTALSPGRPPGTLSPWQERRAKEFFDANLAGDITLYDVARECRLSPGHFSKAFKRTTGKSPHLWLIECRVAAAQSLLRSSDMALAQIALACGFGDQSHLTRVFHKRVGSAPGQWRRMRS